MNCFKTNRPKISTTRKTQSSYPENPRNLQHNVLFRIPECTAHLIKEGEALELARGHFTILSIAESNTLLATTIKIGEKLQWPLTKDEPVVKLDALHYLFSLPIKDGDPLSYGVAFPGQFAGDLHWLDSFLLENCCFSGLPPSSLPARSTKRDEVVWKEYAPRIENYNGVLARAIAGGTGHIVKGIFMCSNAYANQVQKGGEAILALPQEKNNGVWAPDNLGDNKLGEATKKSNVNDSLKRVRKVSMVTEKLSKNLLDSVSTTSESVMAPVVRSQAGKAFLSSVPGEVLLASLDAVNKIFDAAEVAEKQVFSATTGAATRMVSNRFGESAGEATGDVLATAEHLAGTAWNIFKMRKAINPSKTASSGLKNAAIKYRP